MEPQLLDSEISEKNIKLSELPEEPYAILRDIELIEPGCWNEVDYSSEEINKAFLNTDWSDKENYSLYLDHLDDPTVAAHSWVGWVKNIRILDTGKLFGDLHIWDEGTAVKVVKAKAKFGISASVKNHEGIIDGALHNFSFKNFSIVTTPAVTPAYINLAQVTGMEAERKKRGMSPAQFYAAPRDPPSSSALPIFDVAHVRNALARFNQTQFRSPSEKKIARAKIIRAAKKFGIKVSENLSDESLSNELKGGIEKQMPEENKESTEVKEEEKKEEPKTEEKTEEKKEEIQENAARKLSSEIKLLSQRISELISIIKLQEEKKEEEEKTEEKKEEPKAEEKPAEEKKEEVTENKLIIKLAEEVKELKEKLTEPDSKTVDLSVGSGIKNTEDIYEGMDNVLKELRGTGRGITVSLK
jgi:hypothetical protein